MRTEPVLRFPEFNEDYKKIKLKNITSIRRGSSPRPIDKFVNKGYCKWLKITDINSKYVTEIKQSITQEGANKGLYAPKGSLILTNSASPGIPAFNTIECYLNDGFLLITPTDKLHFDYFYYNLLTNRKKLLREGAGAVFTNLKKDIVENFVFNVPMQKEQTKIADFLSIVDDKINLQEMKLENLKLFKRGFIQLELNKHKEKYSIEEILKHVKYKAKGSTPLYNNNNGNLLLTNDYLIDNTKAIFVDNPNNVNNNDVLILWDGSNAGTAYTNVSGVCGSTFLKLQLKKSLNNFYLVENIMNDINIIKSVREGSGIPHVPKDFLTYYRIPIPTIEEQIRLIKVTNLFDKKYKLLKDELKTLKEFN